MIWHMSYASCDVCGDPAPLADDAREARAVARREGWTRPTVNGRKLDLCRKCSRADQS